MEILVNGEPLDFSLEQEQSLGEVIDGIQQWLHEGEFLLTSLTVNNEQVPIHNRDEWDSRGIETLQSVQIEALPRNQVDQTTILALDEYLSMLHAALQEGDNAAMRELADELPHVQERISQLFPSLSDENGMSTVLRDDALKDGVIPRDQALTDQLNEVARLRSLLMSRAREYAHPVRELAITLGQLSAASDELEEVPVQLQTGHGAEAMKSVITLTELLGRVFRLTPLVSAAEDAGGLDIEKIRTFTLETGEVLSELQQAFEIQDTVLVGDLLEYELAPRMRSVSELVPDGDSA
jgi:hypothetical protein